MLNAPGCDFGCLPVSVVIPTYNRAGCLARALDSVLRQTHAASEIIVVDDGSSDATPQLIADRYPQVSYIRQANCGVSSARNRGIEAACGTWIAFLDSDDEWLPTKLERQLTQLHAAPAYRVGHCNEIWIRSGQRVNPKHKHRKFGGWIFQQCLPLCAISPSAVLVHRDVFADIGLFDETLPACEDYDLWLRLCARYPVQFIDTALLVKYGGHADQLSSRYEAMDRFRIKALEKIIEAPYLAPSDRTAALTILLEKIAVYVHGAEKRGRHEAVRDYREKMQRYTGLLDAAIAPVTSCTSL
ncbi:MAG: glycosyltransferase [Gammaproteobacteria bacterium]|nr:glycosyltransferase [Gammaproteobacteria bacterium]MDH3465034.1 glycosyltransferase [Gammaproteobacteria bacterium]